MAAGGEVGPGMAEEPVGASELQLATAGGEDAPPECCQHPSGSQCWGSPPHGQGPQPEHSVQSSWYPVPRRRLRHIEVIHKVPISRKNKKH